MRAPTQILPELAELIGWEATAAIVRHVGGQSRNIPRHVLPEHWLVQFIGLEKAERLCERYGGEILYFPKNDGGVRQLRDAEIRSSRAAGATINALATEFRLTDRQIYSILAATEEG